MAWAKRGVFNYYLPVAYRIFVSFKLFIIFIFSFFLSLNVIDFPRTSLHTDRIRGSTFASESVELLATVLLIYGLFWLSPALFNHYFSGTRVRYLLIYYPSIVFEGNWMVFFLSQIEKVEWLICYLIYLSLIHYSLIGSGI